MTDRRKKGRADREKLTSKKRKKNGKGYLR
jgi:hypothetical protein